jgi:tRNA-intron endonuclease, archaea type
MSVKCLLIGNKVIVDNSTFKGQLVQKGFGENKGRNLILDIYEAIFLELKEKISLVDAKGEPKKAKDLFVLGMKKDKEFYSKLIVYSDIREKGFSIKTGLKFGFDFRVYPKGKIMGQAHSKFVIKVFDQNTKISMPEVSGLSRLSGNLHTKAVLAVVDSENYVSYYSIERTQF